MSADSVVEYLLVPALAVVSLLLFVMIFVGLAATKWDSAADTVRTWAADSGLEVVDLHFCLWQRAFFLYLQCHSIYRIAARDQQGTLRKGWVRVNRWTGHIDVKWAADSDR